MAKPRFTTRVLALLTALCLSLPNSALALRQTESVQSGMEQVLGQSLRKPASEVSAHAAAGAEELGRPGISPQRRALWFGAGKIGRGRGGPILSGQNGFDVIFVDPVPEIIDSINRLGRYSVTPMGSAESVQVENVWGISLQDRERIVAQALWADWIFTSVRPENLPSLAPLFQQIVQKRMEGGRDAPLNIVFAENLPVDQPQVEQVRRAVLQGKDRAFEDFVRKNVGFVGAIVRGGVPENPGILSNPIDVFVKAGPAAFYLDLDAIRGPPPDFKGGLLFVRNIRSHREKKALIHNGPQLILGLLAAIKGLPDSREAMKDVEILSAVVLAAQEAVEGLAAIYPQIFTKEELIRYANEFFEEYSDPSFTMSVQLLVRSLSQKLAANERLFGSIRNTQKAGVSSMALALGIAAARRYLSTHADSMGLNVLQVSRLQRRIRDRARQFGLTLPKNTDRDFQAAWRELIGHVGQKALTISSPVRHQALANYDALVNQEVQVVLENHRRKQSGSYWVAATGPTAAGKTRLLTLLEDRLREQGVPVVHLTEDELGVIDRATRSAWEAQADPRWKEWRNWIRWDKVLGDIQKVKEAGERASKMGTVQTVTLNQLYDRAKGGTTDGVRPVEIHPDTVIVYDGILLTEKYPAGTFDRLLLFDIEQQESLRRSILRDVGYGRDPRTILRYQQVLYQALWASYVEGFHPEMKADAVYDLTDFNKPVRLFYAAAGAEGISREKVAEAVGQFRVEGDPAVVVKNIGYYLEGEGAAFAPILALLEVRGQLNLYSFSGVVETNQEKKRLMDVVENDLEAKEAILKQVFVVENQPVQAREEQYEAARQRAMAVLSGTLVVRITRLETDLLAQLNRILSYFGARLPPEDASVREAAATLLEAA